MPNHQLCPKPVALRLALALALILMLSTANAATPVATPPSATAIVGRIHRAMAAGHSLKEFYSQLGQQYGGAAIAPLLQITADDKMSDETRWAALFGLARLAGRESIGVIRQFMTNSSWMLRDAALKTAAALDARELEPQIIQRLKDDALIVRTTAVEAIGHLKLRDSAPKLVDALFDPANFHGGKALWIHKHILSVLAEMKYDEATPKLVELLENSKDPELQGNIIGTLEKLTGKRFANKTITQQVYLWKRNTQADTSF